MGEVTTPESAGYSGRVTAASVGEDIGEAAAVACGDITAATIQEVTTSESAGYSGEVCPQLQHGSKSLTTVEFGVVILGMEPQWISSTDSTGDIDEVTPGDVDGVTENIAGEGGGNISNHSEVVSVVCGATVQSDEVIVPTVGETLVNTTVESTDDTSVDSMVKVTTSDSTGYSGRVTVLTVGETLANTTVDSIEDISVGTTANTAVRETTVQSNEVTEASVGENTEEATAVPHHENIPATATESKSCTTVESIGGSSVDSMGEVTTSDSTGYCGRVIAQTSVEVTTEVEERQNVKLFQVMWEKLW